MRLISLNTWGGRLFDSFAKYITTEAESTDVFCFQEVFQTNSDIHTDRQDPTDGFVFRVNLFSEITKLLPNFQGYFANAQDGFLYNKPVNYNLSYGLATFVKRNIFVGSHKDIFIFGEKNSQLESDKVGITTPRNLQYVNLKTPKENELTIGNLHGLWKPGPKTDSEATLGQSKRVKTFLDKTPNPKILCGDFNLLPETKSLRILEENMVDLVKKFDIHSTRSVSFKYETRYADYMLVSPDVVVERFNAPHINVSDHLPLVLEFSA